MATQRGDRHKARKATLFDSAVRRETREAMAFLAGVLESSTELLGAARSLQKPFSIKELCQAVQEALGAL